MQKEKFQNKSDGIQQKDILDKINALEAKYNRQFAEVFNALKYLLEPQQQERSKIGFKNY